MTFLSDVSSSADRPLDGFHQTSTPRVSVIVLTYNHEQSIADAVKSVLVQRFSEPFEILIAEDHSTDQTRKVLANLAELYPQRFAVLDRGENLGLSRNLEDAFRRCRGQYISILEGDDAWIDPTKLKRVVTALDDHPKWTGCFHNCRVEYLDNSHNDEIKPGQGAVEELNVSSLIRRNVIPTYSAMTYRRGVVTEFPEWHRHLMNGDWGLHILHAAQGPIGFLSDVMTAYRVHAGGLWSGKPALDRLYETLALWSAIDVHFGWKYEADINKARALEFSALQREYADLKRIEKRYHALQLDKIAAAFHPAITFFRNKLRRTQ